MGTSVYENATMRNLINDKAVKAIYSPENIRAEVKCQCMGLMLFLCSRFFLGGFFLDFWFNDQ